MTGDRYVLLGLARPRAAWFRSVAQWATSAALPADFTKCVSGEEVKAHLRTGRRVSAVLLDAGLPAVDRDLVTAVREAGSASLVVADARVERDWVALGASAVLPPALTRDVLLGELGRHAVMLPRPDENVGWSPPLGEPVPAPWEGRLAVVCGPGGTGASTAAIALAQGLAASRDVLLADFRLRSEQAMLHDAGDVHPALEELVEAHRVTDLPTEEVRGLTFTVAARGYSLLLGLRSPRHWAALRPKAFESGLGALRRTFDAVVCDVDADFEAEDDAGSADVADRCMLARIPAQQADAVFVVGVAGMKGLHSLARIVHELTTAGVEPQRVQPVVNAAPRQPPSRAGAAATLAELTAPGVPAPVFLPRRRVGQALRDGAPLPNPLPQIMARAWDGAFARAGTHTPSGVEPERVRPGSLGSWSTGPQAAGA